MVKQDKPVRKRRLALLLPAHNEELIIQATIRSAVSTGQHIQDIFVVDDNSNDQTREKALGLLPASNVLSVPRSGKALAVQRAIRHFKIEARYTWLHIADADSIFGPNYFRLFKGKLRADKYVVALGFVQSLRGNWISKYRTFTYTYGQHIIRRIQSYLGMISVFPGPTTCFQTRILKDIDFDANSLTEDFDITLQVHRKRLGKIRFIPEAINFTQDPQSLKDFCKQTQRWQRGYFQGISKHKIGRRRQAIDFGIGYQLTEVTIYILQVFVLFPLLIITSGAWNLIPKLIIADFIIISVLGLFVAISAHRFSVLLALPSFYVLRFVELAIFVCSFVEVVILRKFTEKVKGWDTEGRRYALDSNALKDTAQ